MVEALRREDPEPWRYVAEWADGKARHSGNSAVWEGLFFAGFWNVISWPLVGAVTFEATGHPVRFIFWAYPLFGVWLGIRAARAIRHRVAYGETIFTMDTFPGVVGESLAGTVLTGIAPDPARRPEFTVTLSCVRRREEMSSSSSSSSNRVTSALLSRDL